MGKETILRNFDHSYHRHVRQICFLFSHSLLGCTSYRYKIGEIPILTNNVHATTPLFRHSSVWTRRFQSRISRRSRHDRVDWIFSPISPTLCVVGRGGFEVEHHARFDRPGRANVGCQTLAETMPPINR